MTRLLNNIHEAQTGGVRNAKTLDNLSQHINFVIIKTRKRRKENTL